MDIRSIQYLRGIAAMMVVFDHFSVQMYRMGYHGYWPDWIASGVDIFFVLSGLLMWITTRGRSPGVWTFYKRRAVRIVPLYWVLTTVAVAVYLVAPQLLQSLSFGFWHTVASYAFVMVPGPSGDIAPIMIWGWTLNYEMLFYVIFGLTLLLPTAWRFATTAVVLFALCLTGWLFVTGSSHPILQGYTSDIMLEFLFGMALGAWFSDPAPDQPRKRSIMPGSATWGWMLVVGGFAVIVLLAAYAPNLTRPLARGLPSMAIVAGALMLERYGSLPTLKSMHRLGDASYSLYLSHPFVLSALGQLWRKLHLDARPIGWIGFCLVATVACTVVGWLVFRGIEEPLIHLFKKRREQEADKAAARRSVAGL